MPSASIRPVTRRLPSSSELWDDTNLPLCAVLTPCTWDDEEDDNQQPHRAIRPLSSIPKCLNCGAPHPTKATHFRPMHHSVLLCYLCGKTSSTLFRDQKAARVEEKLDIETYDRELITDGYDKDLTFQVPLYEDTWTAPAMTCPPVWWIILDASQTKRTYWDAVCTVLERAMAEIPPYVHVGLVAANSTQVSSWDLTSAIPHVWHYPYNSTQVDFCLVPADSIHLSCIHSALRAVGDAQGTLTTQSDGTAETTGMSLGLTIEFIMDFMDQAKHPGDVTSNPQEDVGSGTTNDLRYAGGKILCLLGNTPMEFGTKVIESQPHYFQGGVAGACSALDKWQGNEMPTKEPTDMTPGNLKDYVKPLEPEDLFDTIGTRCANAALGVDIIVIVPEAKEVGDDDNLARLAIRPWYGLPLLRVLSDTSGAPGPLMFGSSQVERLQEQVLARAPWSPGMTFGAEVRLRISPGFQVEGTPIDPVGKAKLQLAPFLSSGGIAGPAISIDSGLWLMGSCDPYTSLTVDLQVDKNVNDRFHVDGFGEVALKPVLQTCVAYTRVVEDDRGKPQTVRMIRISSLSMPLADDVEPMYDALDPEALAAALFHKLSLNAMQEGFVEAQETGLNWLKSLLICCYQSAQVEQAKIEEQMEKRGMAPATTEPIFVASERLVDIDGELEFEDVLMGKGHAKIAVMPLMLYALLQCDALRPTCGCYRPSMDARCAAISQMASMPPSILAKCIAPSLQLWSTRDDEPILENIDLNKMCVINAVEQMNGGDGVFLLDSPQQILVYRSDRIYPDMTKCDSVKLGPRFKSVVTAASNAYRTVAPISFQLNPPVSREKEDMASLAFDFHLLEDKPTVGGIKNFADWKIEIALQVQDELQKTGDLIAKGI